MHPDDVPRRRVGLEADADAELPEDADKRLQAEVLSHLLAVYPAQLSVGELVVALAEDPTAFTERDDIERAVRDLARVGLLHRHGSFVWPTRAARYAVDDLPLP